jgi:A/G-specific adenine glycosylase
MKSDEILYSVSKELSQELISWYQANSRKLPWRENPNPYSVWISEIMLQQTQVKTVLPYYQRWMDHFPDIESLADADMETLLKAWEGLGYYRRVYQLKAAAEIIVYKLNSQFPSNYDGWLALPGIGPYTAAALASILNGEKYGVVDGNSKRVVSRLFMIETELNTPIFKKTIAFILEKSFFEYDPGNMNQAWMELGALVCLPKPHCQNCPLKTHCEAWLHNRMKDFPVKKARQKTPLLEGAAFILRQGEKLLMVKRANKGLLSGMWELPNTIYEEQPLADFTLANDIFIDRTFIEKARHQYSHFKVEFDIIEGHLRSDWWNDYWVDYRWLLPAELKTLPIAKVHHLALAIAGVKPLP